MRDGVFATYTRVMNTSHFRSVVLFTSAYLFFGIGSLRAQSESTAPTAPAGSSAFCLFEAVAGERRQWVNLAHVQYVEQRADEIRLYYGGGNLGSGHELRIPAKTADEAAAVIQKMKREAARCSGK